MMGKSSEIDNRQDRFAMKKARITHHLERAGSLWIRSIHSAPCPDSRLTTIALWPRETYGHGLLAETGHVSWKRLAHVMRKTCARCEHRRARHVTGLVVQGGVSVARDGPTESFPVSERRAVSFSLGIQRVRTVNVGCQLGLGLGVPNSL